MSTYSIKKMAGLPVNGDDIKNHELIITESTRTKMDKKPVDTKYGKESKKPEVEDENSDKLNEDELDKIMENVKDIEIITESEKCPCGSEKCPCNTISEGEKCKCHDGKCDCNTKLDENDLCNTITEADEATAFDMYGGDSDRDESPSPYPEDNDKMPFPPELKKSLQKEIDELHQAAANMYNRDEDTRRFYHTCAEAMRIVLQLLSKETIHGFKEAQIEFQTYMGPIQQKFPDRVFDFLTRGGKPQSVSTLFKNIKEIK